MGIARIAAVTVIIATTIVLIIALNTAMISTINMLEALKPVNCAPQWLCEQYTQTINMLRTIFTVLGIALTLGLIIVLLALLLEQISNTPSK